MKSVLIILFTLCLTQFAQARKPAVEDFVGVEPETYKSTPPGTEVLFNFEKNVQQYKDQKTEELSTQSPWFGVGVMVAFIALPFMMWYGLKQQTPQVATAQSEAVSADENVHNIEDYRKSEDESKKASQIFFQFPLPIYFMKC